MTTVNVFWRAVGFFYCLTARQAIKYLVCFVVPYALFFFFSTALQGQDTVNRQGANRQGAIDRGLQFLARRQKSDGSFGEGMYHSDAGVSAFAGMAFLSSGEVDDFNRKPVPATRCADYLLSITHSDGFINRLPNSDYEGSFRPMYGHGFAVLFLSEIFGMYDHPELTNKLDLSVRLIVATQNEEGGWRYYPRKADADVSVTACQVMALRAARNAGRDVPAETIRKAVSYFRKCQNSDGSFMYMLPDGSGALPRSAAVVAGLLSAGEYNTAPLNQGLQYIDKSVWGTEKEGKTAFFLRANRNLRQNSLDAVEYPYYSIYYLTGIFWQQKEKWTRWENDVVPVLLATQNPDGSWSSEFSSDYATAIALIVLQARNNYLPIWQR